MRSVHFTFTIGVFIALLGLLCRGVEMNEVRLTMDEEEPIGTVVTNLFKNAFPSTNHNDQLKILNEKERGVNCFKISPLGDLLIARRFDRDIICQQSSKSEILGTEECKITLQIAAESGNTIIRIVIIVDDKNDNAPKWNQNPIELNFTDGCKENTKTPLTPAHDIDFGLNAQIDYSIKESGLPFRVNTMDGLYLEALQSLDREFKETYQFTLVATDKGRQARSTEVEVRVTVVDINDNNPIFSIAIYRFKSISESSPVGTVIGKLEATDADSGVNGKFHFRISNSASESVKYFFSVHTDGTVTIKAPLDCDKGVSQLKFKVIVEDEALKPYSRSSESTVEISITDVNDEVPEIKFIFLNRDSRTNSPFITEHSRIGTLVGNLEVEDRDFSGNDVVTCQDPPYFTLLREDKQSKYKIETNVEFDREKTADVTLVIVCHDAAGNRAARNRTIIIKDINDNAPTFSKAIYVVKIKENMPIGSRLSEKVLATDADSDNHIQYSLMKEYTSNFTINRDLGFITTLVSFDREECESYFVKVLATDATGGDANTGTCTVQVLILDENDNNPVFSQDFYTFHISENNTPSTKVGQIEAKDFDSSDQRNSLKYYFDHSPINSNFQIDQRSGVIRARVSLDREKMTHYIFPVFVEDGQHMSSKVNIATSTVTVIVEDVNDNAPKFVIPNATKSLFEISIKETAGHKITYIVAEDQDYQENSRISYSITMGNDLNLFSLDRSSGLLFLSDSLQSSPHNSRPNHILTVTACDAGKPKTLCTDFKNLRIIIKNGQDTVMRNSDIQADSNIGSLANKPHQDAIIICLAIVFITLLVSSAALLFLMKCKPAIWCRRPTRATSKDKGFETCANSQMLSTIDANVKERGMVDAMRNFCSENQPWLQHETLQPNSGKMGIAFDHTNRPDYQTLESLCLASSMRFSPQPRFVDPCSRPHTLAPFSQSTSFLTNHDLKRVNRHASHDSGTLLPNGHNQIYQYVEDNNNSHCYSKLNDTKGGSQLNVNEHNLNQVSIENSCGKDVNKYISYSYNEASFV